MPCRTLYDKGNKSFLSDAHDEHGAVGWSVCVERYYSGDKKDNELLMEVRSSLRIQDCSRNIHLDFDSMETSVTEKSKLERIAKLDTLINQLQQYRFHLDKSYDIALEHNKTVQANEDD